MCGNQACQTSAALREMRIRACAGFASRLGQQQLHSQVLESKWSGTNMDVESILKYQANPNEDYYALLGCDISTSTEQILAEFKARAKDCHPDKNAADPKCQETFQHLLRVSHATVGKVK